MTPEEIREQRAQGWPDVHPEDYCHRCGRPNAGSWFVQSVLWNFAVESRERGVLEILCPPCFVELFEAAGGGRVSWELRPDSDTSRALRADLAARCVLKGELTGAGLSGLVIDDRNRDEIVDSILAALKVGDTTREPTAGYPADPTPTTAQEVVANLPSGPALGDTTREEGPDSSWLNVCYKTGARVEHGVCPVHNGDACLLFLDTFYEQAQQRVVAFYEQRALVERLSAALAGLLEAFEECTSEYVQSIAVDDLANARALLAESIQEGPQ